MINEAKPTAPASKPTVANVKVPVSVTESPLPEPKSVDAKPISTIPLKTLCAETNLEPRLAREKLRIAVREPEKYPELSKAHKARQAWEWPKDSAALNEARAALTT